MWTDFTAKYVKITGSYSPFPLGMREEMMGLKYKPQNGFKLQQERFQLNIRGTLSNREGKYGQRRLPVEFVVFPLLKVFKNLSDKRLSRMRRDKPAPFFWGKGAHCILT